MQRLKITITRKNSTGQIDYGTYGDEFYNIPEKPDSTQLECLTQWFEDTLRMIFGLPKRHEIKFQHHGEPVTHCKSCNAKIFWIKTESGRNMPVNVDTLTSHFSTCPQAEKWRKGKGHGQNKA